LFGYAECTVVDTEFSQPAGERPRPKVLVARELASGKVHRLYGDALLGQRRPPYPIGPDALVVAFQATAEISVHIAMGWQDPANLLDLRIEFLNYTNGHIRPNGTGLIGASMFFGLPVMDVGEKEANRELAICDKLLSNNEWKQLVDYCESDVDATCSLLRKMEPHIDLERALLRGRYMIAAAHIEDAGIPLDVEMLARFKARWDGIRSHIIDRIDAQYRVFENGHFRAQLWEKWLQQNRIPWPRLATGTMALDDDTFRQQAKAYSAVAPMQELRQMLGQLHLNKLAVGADGRNRTQLWPFAARTGRNQPSNSKFIFGPSRWIRGLIRPTPGHVVAYIDWAQQEFGIAAALSGDTAMIHAYESGDPYLAFAIQARAAPSNATKKSHRAIRNQFKECAIGTLYSMGPMTLAERTGLVLPYAADLLRLHHVTYPQYWRWADRVVDYALMHSHLYTSYGWNLLVGPDAKPASLRNFPMQGNGAEMLRLACCLAIERGVKVIAPVHDALLIEASVGDMVEAIVTARRAMADASRMVTGAFELRSEVKVFRHPMRFQGDDDVPVMWLTVQQILRELEGK
jgi:hypothetical protein